MHRNHIKEIKLYANKAMIYNNKKRFCNIVEFINKTNNI